MRALVAWRGGLFLTEGKIVVLSVSSLQTTQPDEHGILSQQANEDIFGVIGGSDTFRGTWC